MTYITKALLLLATTTTCMVSAIGNSIDSSSYANIDDISTTHMELNFTVNFDEQFLAGYVINTMRVHKPYINSAFFDAEGMSVYKAEVKYVKAAEDDIYKDWVDTQFNVTRPNNNLGNAIEVHLPERLPVLFEIQVRLWYITNENTTAISWLKPSQTAGK